jgi:hypothetical protein
MPPGYKLGRGKTTIKDCIELWVVMIGQIGLLASVEFLPSTFVRLKR